MRRTWAVVAVTAIACLSAPLVPVRPPPLAAAALGAGTPVAPIAWSPCPTPAGFECANVRVPATYRRPGGAFFPIAVIEHPATDPVGTPGDLLFNPGGPGESGVQILPILASAVPAAVARQFNLVSFDERGTGQGGRLACGPTPAVLTSLAPAPSTPGGPLPGSARYAQLATSCARRYPSVLPTIGTEAAARDMDRIRQALGVARIDYWGLSYGTVLGSVYAHLFPTKVGAMILDGAVDAEQSLASQARLQAPAVAAALSHYFATCGATASCPPGPDPRVAYQRLAAALRRHPLPAPGDGDDVPVTVGDLYTATLLHLSVPGIDNSFGQALAAAAGGDGGPLRAIALEFELDIDGTSLVGAQWAYACNDAGRHPGPRAAGRLASSLAARYGTAAAVAVPYTLGGCTSWPAPRHPVASVAAGRGAPTIVVIGNTGDPNTPHAGAVALAGALGPVGRLVTWRGWGHTWLLNGPSDPCMQGVVTAYLVAGHPPANGTTCR